MPFSEPEKTTFKAGDLLLFTTGEYEDYGISMLTRALATFDIRDCISPETDRLLVGATLIARGLVENVEFHEVDTTPTGTISNLDKVSKRLLCRHDMPRTTADMGNLGTWTVCQGCDSRMLS